MVDLKTKIGDLVFKNPVTVASGTFGVKDEYAPYFDYALLGGVITKTVTVKPRVGNEMPRICETASGMHIREIFNQATGSWCRAAG